VTKVESNKVKEKTDEEGKPRPAELNGKAHPAVNAKSEKSESSVERRQERERDRSSGQDCDGQG
jgi:cyclin L